MIRLLSLTLIISTVLIFTSCAQQKPPTGGPKDVTPPEVLSTTPENFSTNFDAAKISIEFDEFVQLRNASQQIVINPTMEKRPTYSLRGKKLMVNLNSELAENTTYVINFGDAVVDLTEGNKAVGLQYVFSTGPLLDSLQVKGRVIDAFDQKPTEQTLVMLYKNDSDTMPYKGIPDYFAKTDATGNFEINYIRDGNYSVFALQDENGNYRYDPPTEAIGFISEQITPGPPDSTNTPAAIMLFMERDTTQYVTSRTGLAYGQFQTVLYQPTDSFYLEALNPQYQLLTEKGKVGDTLTTWFTNRSQFAELTELQFLLYAEPGYRDTITWRLNPTKDEKEPAMLIRENLLFNLNPYRPMRFIFNHPIARVDTQKIELYADSTSLDFEWLGTDSPREFELHHNWKPGRKYRFFAPDSTFFDVFGLTNDTIDKAGVIREERYYGNLMFDLEYESDIPVILEMLNDRKKVIERVFPERSGEISFEKLPPGTYSMRVIYDLNHNGQWDTGNYKENQQPEPVEIYQNNIQVRSNWDLELTWSLTPLEDRPAPQQE